MKRDNSKKYAKVLFSVVGESAEADETGELLKTFVTVCNKETMGFFSNPFIAENKKVEIIKTTLTELPDAVVNLLRLLIKKNEMRCLAEISKKYNKLLLDSKNIITVIVVSAEKLESSVNERVKNYIRQITKKNVLLTEEIDKSIIGGLVIKAGDLVIDGSIKGKLKSICVCLLK